MKILLVVLVSGVLFTGCTMETEPPADPPGDSVVMKGKVSCVPGDQGKFWFEMNFKLPDPQNPNFEQWQRVGPKTTFNCTTSVGPIGVQQAVSHSWVLGQRYPYRLVASYATQPEDVDTVFIFDKNGTMYYGWDVAYQADPTYGIYDSYVKPLG